MLRREAAPLAIKRTLACAGEGMKRGSTARALSVL